MADLRLPDRLFATGHYPSNRLNVYSKLDLLTFIHHHMRGLPQFQIIRESQFGKLFDIPANRCPTSGKLIHALLSRQLVSKNKYTMHLAFGGHPLRFSLKEFGVLTGLNCSEFPEDHEPYFNPPNPTEPDAIWKELLGDDGKMTLADMSKKLEEGKLEDWQKLRFALILIVDGVLVASHQYPKPTAKYVTMLGDLDSFLNFPWGRESFLKTLSGMRPGKKPDGKREDMPSLFRGALNQSSYSLKGFPIALQLLAFQAIPQLLEKLPHATDQRTLIQLPDIKIPQHTGLTLKNILRVENSPALAVIPRLNMDNPPNGKWGEWPDEYEDPKVDYMDRLIDQGHAFQIQMWPGGDASLPVQTVSPSKPKPSRPKQHIVTRRKLRPRPTETNLGADEGSSSTKKRKRKSKPTSTGTICAAHINALQTQVAELLEQQQHLTKRVAYLEKKRRVRNLVRAGRFSSHLPKSRSKRCAPNERSSTPIHRSQSLEKQGENKEEHIIRLTEPTPSPQKAEKDPSITETPSPARHVHPSLSVSSNSEHDQIDLADNTSTCTPLDINPGSSPKGIAKPPAPPTSVKEIDEELEPLFTYHQPTEFHETDAMDVSNDEIHVPSTTSAESHQNKTVPTVQLDPSPRTAKTNDKKKDSDHAQESVDTKKDYPQIIKAEMTDGGVMDVDQKERHLVMLETHSKTSSEEANLDKVTAQIFKDANISPSLAPDLVKQTATSMDQRSVGTSIGNQGQSSTEHPVDHLTPCTKTNPIEVSDGSPVKPTPKHCPSELERDLHIILQSLPKHTSVFPRLEQEALEAFQFILEERKYVLHRLEKWDINNQFFIDLYTPQKWVNTTHIEVLLDYLGTRDSIMMKEQGLAYASPWFTSQLQSKHRQFDKAKDKKKVRWDERITTFINSPGNSWLDNVETIYAPMIWDSEHWVGLAINLKMWHVEILDPNPDATADKYLQKLMAPVTEMLPFIIRTFCTSTLTQPHGANPFGWTRLPGLYKNLRAGDCGPVAVKFMEFHAHANPDNGLETMDDRMVDAFRMQYAMDTYKHLVIPTYPSPPLG